MRHRIDRVQKAMDNWPDITPKTVAYKIRGTDDVVSWVHYGADDALCSIEPDETQEAFHQRAAEQFGIEPDELVDNVHHMAARTPRNMKTDPRSPLNRGN